MKHLIVVFMALTLGLIIFLTGCNNSDDNPFSYVDDYTVNLTEAKGTTYTGDYFPLQEGYTCYYSGSASMHIKAVIPGYPKVDETTNAPATGMLKVLTLTNIPLSSGTLPLYPIVDISDMEGQVIADTSRYFMKDAEAVYIKALKLSDGSYLEVENPIYIKSNLEVGDSWETAPKMDMTKLLISEFGASGVQSNIDLNARAKFFVVGHENISLPFGIRNAIRLEQANDITMTGTMTMQGTIINMDISAQLAIEYHMIADTGIVRQNITGPLDMEMSAEGETVTININFNNFELKLTNLSGNTYYIDSDSALSKRTISAQMPKSFNTPNEEKMWKVSQAIARVLIKNLSH